MSLKFRSLVIAFVGLVAVFLFIQFPMWFLLVHREQRASFTQLTRGLTKLRSTSLVPSQNPYVDQRPFVVSPEGAGHHREAFGDWELPSHLDDVADEAVNTTARSDDVHKSIVRNALMVEELTYTSRARQSQPFELTIVAFSLDTMDECSLPWYLLSEAITMVTATPLLVDILLVTSLPLSSAEHRDSSCWGVLRSIGMDPFTLEAVFSPSSVVRLRPLTVSQGGRSVSKQLVTANAWGLVSQMITLVAPSVAFVVFLGPQVDIAEVDLTAIAEGYRKLQLGTKDGEEAHWGLLAFTVTIGQRISSAGIEVKRSGSQLVVAERLAGFNALDTRGSQPKVVLWPGAAAFGASLSFLKSFWPAVTQVIPLQAPEASAASSNPFIPSHQTRPFLMFLTLLSLATNGTATTLQTGVRVPLQQTLTINVDSPMLEGGFPLIEVLEEAVSLTRGRSSTKRSADIHADLTRDVNTVYQRIEREFHNALFPMNNSVLLEWETFCIPCFGFTNEVMHFIVPLEELVLTYTPHDSQCFCSGTPKGFQESLARLSAEPPEKSHWAAARRSKRKAAHSDSSEGTSPFYVLVSHKDPGSFPRFSAVDRPDYVIGRAMYEFNKIPQPWLSHVVDVDEVWVPCRFVQWVFERAGFPSEKLVVIPEPIDVFMYDPLAVLPVQLPPSSLDWTIASTCDEPLPNTNGSAFPRCHDSRDLATHFKFFSVFKWEDRKGWEELLTSYLTEFDSESDKVSLYLVTYLYGEKDGRNPKSIMRKIKEFVARKLTELTWPYIPHIVIIASQLTEQEMIAMYGSVDAFVLPTRGEGWGLPAIQAMSMALPTIVTNWSGIVDFATDQNSFLIPVESLEDLPLSSAYGYETGKKWALPSVSSLKRILRDVVTNPEKAKERGRRARRDIIAQFSDEAVAQTVRNRLRYLKEEHEKPVKDKLHEAVEAILEDRHLIV